jgi:hypothetical protein
MFSANFSVFIFFSGQGIVLIFLMTPKPKSDLIVEINPMREAWSLIVCIVPIWFFRDVLNCKLPFSLDMVMNQGRTLGSARSATEPLCTL